LPEIDGDRSDAGPRLISSTALNLEDEIRAGHFRVELYYRINGVSLHLPSLSQRKEDIPDLVELFLTKHSAIQGRTQPYLDAQDFVLLQEFSWPGNIRELENVVKKMVVLGNPKTVISELVAGTTKPRSVAAVAKSSVLKAATQAASRGAERQMILDALGRTRWNRKRAAQELQISYKSLLSKLKQIGAEEPDKM
jgi:DNA-binding NtrC family response regulator